MSDINHDEALQLAHLKRQDSNLARCYLALKEEAEREAVRRNAWEDKARRLLKDCHTALSHAGSIPFMTGTYKEQLVLSITKCLAVGGTVNLSDLVMPSDTPSATRRKKLTKLKRKVKLCPECGANMPWHVATCTYGMKPAPFGGDS